VRTRDFRRLETRRQVLAGAIVNRPARFSEFLGSFHAHEPPTLHVLHLLVPHVPLRFLPSGFEYPPPVPEIGRQGDLWTDGADAVALTHQRALLQTAYLDRLVGQLTARLRATGLLDRATVVLTADHGIAYEQGQPSRALNDVDLPASLYPQLLWAPLLVHAPGQHDGRVSDANVMSIDVLPTVARLASIRIPWPVDGVPAGERDDDTKEFQRAHSDAAGGRIDPPIRFGAQAGFAAMLAANVDTVTQAGDPRWQLWRLRGRGDLVGRAVADVDVGPSSDLRVSLQQADALQHVRRASGSLPAMVWGTTDRPATVAIAVNGIVAGVSPPLGTRPGRIAAMLPDFLLHDGRNEIRIYEVPSDPTRAELRPARYLAPDAR
jgi:hypothetical protein